MKSLTHSLRTASAVGACLLWLGSGALSAACTCDPDISFSTVPEISTYPGGSNVDVNRGNTPLNFVRSAYAAVNAGATPTTAFENDQVGRLTGTAGGYWRRIDTVNSILSTAGKPGSWRTYSDPWTSKPPFSSLPCKNTSRDVGAVLMLFSACPEVKGVSGGPNCDMNWANTHVYGMQSGDALYGGGLYNASTNRAMISTELMDARYAGLQFFLPNIYGYDLSNGSVDNLVNGLQDVDGSGVSSQVQVGMFDDVSGYGLNGFVGPPDMANPTNAANIIFTNKWQPYFDKVTLNRATMKYVYKVGGVNPLIYFYNAGVFANQGTGTDAAQTIQKLSDLFLARYGVRPYIAVDTGYWGNAAQQAAMAAVNNTGRFTWRPATSLVNGNSSTFTYNGVTLAHSMPRWDPVGRDNNGSITRLGLASDGIIKDGSYLNAALNSVTSTNSTLLVLATWNDLGEGTGINRNYDYYWNGTWQQPSVFMNMIRASQSGQSCPATTYSPTATPTITPTPTATPLGGHGPLVADMEGNSNTTNDRTLWGANAAIVQYVNASATSDHSPWGPTSASTPGSGSTYAACWSGTMGGSASGPVNYLSFELAGPGGTNQGGPVADVQPYSPNHGFKFDYRATVTSLQYKVQVVTSEVLDYQYYEYVFTPSDTAWHTLTVYFPGYGTPALVQPGGTAVAFNPAHVGALLFWPVAKSTAKPYGLCIDNLTFDVAAAPTPTFTRTVTTTFSITPTFTQSGTPTVTPSVTPSRTATATSSPTATQTLVNTDTFTSTITLSQTPSPSPTETLVLTATPTPTETVVLTATPSSTETVVLTATPTLTDTLVSTFSDTPTSTPLQSATSTQTPTPLVTAPVAGTGVLTIFKALAAPNPVNPKQLDLAVNLSAGADGFELKIYSASMVCLGSFKALGSLYSSGWNKVQFKPVLTLPNGIYYGRLTAVRSGAASVVYSDTIKLLVLR